MRSRNKLFKFICVECSELVENVYRHYTTFHPDKLLFSCYLCPRRLHKSRGNSFTSIKSLVKHHVKYHENNVSSSSSAAADAASYSSTSSEEELENESPQVSEPSICQSSQGVIIMDEDETDEEMHVDKNVLDLNTGLPAASSVAEAAGTFICGLLNEPSLPAVHVFSVADMVTNMYGPLINYLQRDVLPHIDPKFKQGNKITRFTTKNTMEIIKITIELFYYRN